MIPYLQVENLTKSFGDLVLFHEISLVLHRDSVSDLLLRMEVEKQHC